MHDTTIPEGSGVMLLYASANRDADRPYGTTRGPGTAHHPASRLRLVPDQEITHSTNYTLRRLDRLLATVSADALRN